MSLVDIHAQLSSNDEVLEKEAAVEFDKLAEEDAAGRIMARGFMAELHKIAQGIQPIGPGKTVKSKGYDTSAMARAGSRAFGGEKQKVVTTNRTPPVKMNPMYFKSRGSAITKQPVPKSQ